MLYVTRNVQIQFVSTMRVHLFFMLARRPCPVDRERKVSVLSDMDSTEIQKEMIGTDPS